jgi:hypothetical protein
MVQMFRGAFLEAPRGRPRHARRACRKDSRREWSRRRLALCHAVGLETVPNCGSSALPPAGVGYRAGAQPLHRPLTGAHSRASPGECFVPLAARLMAAARSRGWTRRSRRSIASRGQAGVSAVAHVTVAADDVRSPGPIAASRSYLRNSGNSRKGQRAGPAHPDGTSFGGRDRCLEMLRDHSRVANRKLVDVASAVVDSHLLLPKGRAPSLTGRYRRTCTSLAGSPVLSRDPRSGLRRHARNSNEAQGPTPRHEAEARRSANQARVLQGTALDAGAARRRGRARLGRKRP